jgi:hypothetical protein
MGEFEERFSTNNSKKESIRYRRRLSKILSVDPHYKITPYISKKLHSQYFTLDKRQIKKITRKSRKK